MKHNLPRLLAMIVFFISTTYSYSQDILWEKSYGGKQTDILMDAQPTADYGFILVGSSMSKKSGKKTDDNIGDMDYWIWKMDEKGDLDWQKSIGGTGNDFLYSLDLTNDGGYILAGTSSSNKGYGKNQDAKGGDDIWIIKLNAKGAEEWQVTLGGSGQEKLSTIKKTIDGGFIIGGSSSSDKSGTKSEDSYGGMDCWVVKIDSNGKLEWQKTIGGLYNDELRSIDTTNKGYIIGAYSNSPISGNKTKANFGAGDYWILKLDENGEIEWEKVFGGTKDDQIYAIRETKDMGYIIGGSSNSDSGGNKSVSNKSGSDFWIVKLNEEGTVKWQETYDFGKVDVFASIVENKDGSYFIGGYAQGEITSAKKTLKKLTGKKQTKAKAGTDDYIALKIKSNGEEMWSKTLGSNGKDLLRLVFETRDGGYLMAGTSIGASSGAKNSTIGGDDFWVVKLRDNFKPKEERSPIEAFPNPTKQFTNVVVGYEFEKGTVTVADLGGRILQQFEVTSRTIPIDLGNNPEGIYVINVNTNIQSDGVKIIKLKN